MPTTPSSALLASWRFGLAGGSIVPYLGPCVLADVSSLVARRALPATSEQLILVMSGGLNEAEADACSFLAQRYPMPTMWTASPS